MLCDYGCGKEARFTFKNKKNCCSQFTSSCEGKKYKGNINSTGKYKENNEIFIIHSPVTRKVIKKRILKNKLLEYKCAICLIGPEWNNKPMPLILDHINGSNNDNRLENLRFVCSNCDSQLDTYKAKNKKRVVG